MAGRRRSVRGWASLDDERLLDLRFRDLDVDVRGSALEPLVGTMWDELAERGLRLKPHVWPSTEWFSPDGVPGIAAPFYLVHPRLLKLERAMMIEAEGSAREECLMILRHEAGHAVQHAWGLQRREGWRRTFGHPSRPYPTTYRPNPASQRFVQHLRQYYAQAHPHEDFAETLAVAAALRRLAGLEEAGVRRRADARAARRRPGGGHAAHRGAALEPHADATRALHGEAGAPGERPAHDPRPRPAAAVRRR